MTADWEEALRPLCAANVSSRRHSRESGNPLKNGCIEFSLSRRIGVPNLLQPWQIAAADRRSRAKPKEPLRIGGRKTADCTDKFAI